MATVAIKQKTTGLPQENHDYYIMKMVDILRRVKTTLESVRTKTVQHLHSSIKGSKVFPLNGGTDRTLCEG